MRDVSGLHAIIRPMFTRALRCVTSLAVLCGLTLCSVWLPARAAATSTACNPADHNQVRLQVSVSGMRSDKGPIIITIYPDQAKRFLDGKYKLARQQLPVIQPVSHTCFVVAAPGYYAVALFHDKNDNHHFDTNWLGIPVEAYGFSRNPKLHFGPPDLGEVRFAAHVGDNPVAITMQRY